ncbi:unnamed protein product [Ectocarpus sp. 13 AM-2016]
MLKASKGDRFHETYEVQPGELGTAAMGCVVRAGIKKRTGEMFACKTFMVSSVPKKKAQRRILETLRNEIDLLRSLDHPNIVRAYESYEVGQDLHLVMELCRGGDLGARTYTEAQAAAVVRQVLSAILHAHQKGICHRDLKFENILWESKAEDAQIKLIDFGMSARFQEGMPMNERVGTVYTMAPEVLRGEYTKQADLWSVGCITFHLISGEPPFECEDEVDTMRRLLAVQYYWPIGSKVSSEAKGFCYNLLKLDPRRRWTVEEAIASPWIKRFAPGGPDASPPATAVARSPRNVNASSAISSSNSRVVVEETTPSTIASSLSTSLAGTAAASAAESPTVPPPDAARLAAGAAGLPPPPSVATSSSSTAAVGGGSAEEAARQTGTGDGKSQEEEEDDDALGEMPQEAPISVRMLSSMRDYRSYGALRRTALMVVAYNQSPDKLRELRNEFVDFDTEKNGKISRGEMRTALSQRGVSPEEIEELFESLDVDHSGDIHYLEFLAATIEAVGATEEVRLRQAFERLDTDESGSITVDNLREIMGPSYDDEAIHKTLEEADAGQDGRVEWEDFLLLMRDRRGVETLVAQERKAVDELKSKISPGPLSSASSSALVSAVVAVGGQGELATCAAPEGEAAATKAPSTLPPDDDAAEEAAATGAATEGRGAEAAEGGGAVTAGAGTPASTTAAAQAEPSSWQEGEGEGEEGGVGPGIGDGGNDAREGSGDGGGDDSLAEVVAVAATLTS